MANESEMKPKDRRRKHASGIVTYYKGMVKSKSGSKKWRETGLQTAQKYLELVEDDATTIDDLTDFLNYLEENREEFGGSVWTDITIGVDYWRRYWDQEKINYIDGRNEMYHKGDDTLYNTNEIIDNIRNGGGLFHPMLIFLGCVAPIILLLCLYSTISGMINNANNG